MATQARNLGGRLPNPFLKIDKGARFWGKKPNCVHLWIESAIENVVLRTSRRKSLKENFSLWSLFFSCVLDEMFIEVP